MEPVDPSVEHVGHPGTDGAPAEVGAAADVGPTSEMEALVGLERDLAAVEEAMAGLDRIAVAEMSGPAAAAQVAAVVGSGRFRTQS